MTSLVLERIHRRVAVYCVAALTMLLAACGIEESSGDVALAAPSGRAAQSLVDFDDPVALVNGFSEVLPEQCPSADPPGGTATCEGAHRYQLYPICETPVRDRACVAYVEEYSEDQFAEGTAVYESDCFGGEFIGDSPDGGWNEYCTGTTSSEVTDYLAQQMRQAANRKADEILVTYPRARFEEEGGEVKVNVRQNLDDSDVFEQLSCGDGWAIRFTCQWYIRYTVPEPTDECAQCGAQGTEYV